LSEREKEEGGEGGRKENLDILKQDCILGSKYPAASSFLPLGLDMIKLISSNKSFRMQKKYPKKVLDANNLQKFLHWASFA
jgi:hypothetical protein